MIIKFLSEGEVIKEIEREYVMEISTDLGWSVSLGAGSAPEPDEYDEVRVIRGGNNA